jgi:TonB family protein
MRPALLFPLLCVLSHLPAAKPAEPRATTYHVGENGVTAPQVKKQVRPPYTEDAMREKIEGVVLMSGVVNLDGRLTNVQVIKSLDSIYGLDNQAVKAAKQWRFIPGKKDNKPVNVFITIEMTFTLSK